MRHTGPYFCQVEDVACFDRAEAIPGPSCEFLGPLARELGIVLVASLFERRAPGLYHNTAVVFERDGSIAGRYRKMHIPDDPAYYEKFYFTPGDLGFTPIDTSVGRLGVLVCWDQWYPEAARLMALAGAELLLYPTASATSRIPARRGRASGSGATASLPVRRASSSRAPATASRRCCWRNSTSGAARMCGASGRSCVTGASTPTRIWCGVTVTSGRHPPDPAPHRPLPAAELNEETELLALLADGEFRSGEWLAGRLGISRAGIWKRVGKLAERGIALERVSGRGYRVPGGIELLDRECIAAALPERVRAQLSRFELRR